MLVSRKGEKAPPLDSDGSRISRIAIEDARREASACAKKTFRKPARPASGAQGRLNLQSAMIAAKAAISPDSRDLLPFLEALKDALPEEA